MEKLIEIRPILPDEIKEARIGCKELKIKEGESLGVIQSLNYILNTYDNYIRIYCYN